MNADSGGLQSLLSMLKTDPANSALRSHCVKTALALNEFELAQQLVDSRLREAPADPHALFDSATILIARKQYADAVPQLGALLANGHRHAAILMNLGLCHYILKDFQAARPPLSEAYERGERSPGLLRLLVSTLHHLGMLDEAVALADAHADMAKQDGPLAGVYALAYLDDEQAAPAARWAHTALEHNPRSVDGLVVQATLRIAQMRTAEAKREFEQALELAPEAGRAWLGLGTLALLEKDLEGAKRLLGKAIEYMGSHVGTLHMLAWTHVAAGDLASAEQIFQQALALNRNFAETHGGLAAVAAFRGDRETAQRAISVAVRLDPECLSAKLAQAVLIGGAGDRTLAQRMIAETAGALASKDASALSRLLGTIARR